MDNSTPPATLPIKSLLVCHAEYDAAKIQLHEALYRGGALFDSLKRSLLRSRDIEANGAGGQAYRNSRLQCANYSPTVAGILDYLSSCALQAEPTLLAEGSDAAFYLALNRNADGSGNDIASIARSRLNQFFLHRRAYLTIQFPDADDMSPADYGEQKAAGLLKGCIGWLDASDVEDWTRDESGKLSMIRTHRVDRVRTSPFSPPNIERHTWTYITDNAIYEYEASRDIESGKACSWNDNAVAVLQSTKIHGLGSLPVVELQGNLFVMDRLADAALQLWQRESALTFALDSSALSLMFIKTSGDLKNIVASELACLKLSVGDEAGYISPDAQMYQALDADRERLREDLFSCITAMALQQQSNASNPRQSAKAKLVDYGALSILIQSFAATLRDALESTVRLLKKARADETTKVDIHGLDEYDVMSAESKVAIAQQFLLLPGMPQSAKRFILESTALTVCSDASADVREDIKKELKNSVIPEMPAASNFNNSKEGSPIPPDVNSGYGNKQ